jgi:alkylation response protein AidB-like acyl-CoA dehydrogenase
MIDQSEARATEELLRATARSVLAARSPAGRIRSLMETAAGFDPELWRETGALGWMGLGIPTEHGGSGLGIEAVALLNRELGRALVPGPYLGTLIAADLLATFGTAAQRDEHLLGLASGATKAAVAVGNGDLRTDGAVMATAAGGRWRLSGNCGFVLDAAGADLLLVAATLPAGEKGLFLLSPEAAGVTAKPGRGLDRTRRPAEVAIEAEVGPDQLLGGAEAVSRALELGALLVAAQLSGTAERVLEMTVAFAKSREQFGHPIGSFQAVAHRLADMHVRTSFLAALVDATAAACARAWSPDQISAAKVWANQTGEMATGASLQIHGAIGFTWEHDLHLYLRRARTDAYLFGSSDWHRDRIATLQGWDVA